MAVDEGRAVAAIARRSSDAGGRPDRPARAGSRSDERQLGERHGTWGPLRSARVGRTPPPAGFHVVAHVPLRGRIAGQAAGRSGRRRATPPRRRPGRVHAPAGRRTPRTSGSVSDGGCAALDRPTGLPTVLILESRSHLDMGDLPNLLAAELGVLTVRLERAIRSLDGVARVHVNRWGDGSAHLHVWFLARPTGRLQLRGTFLSLWDDILPRIPESQWRENLALVAAWLADFGGQALAEPPHIDWQTPAEFTIPRTAADGDDDAADDGRCATPRSADRRTDRLRRPRGADTTALARRPADGVTTVSVPARGRGGPARDDTVASSTGTPAGTRRERDGQPVRRRQRRDASGSRSTAQAGSAGSAGSDAAPTGQPPASANGRAGGRRHGAPADAAQRHHQVRHDRPAPAAAPRRWCSPPATRWRPPSRRAGTDDRQVRHHRRRGQGRHGRATDDDRRSPTSGGSGGDAIASGADVETLRPTR